MSWMDSWSRPSKSQATPPPLYLTIGDSVPYCHSCGRVIGDRKKTSGATEVKYCSARCRHSKPGPLDRRIEATFAKLLEGATPESIKEEQEQDAASKAQEGSKDAPAPKSTENKNEKDAAPNDSSPSKFTKKHKAKKPSKSKSTTKGESRLIIDCTAVEHLVFTRTPDPTKTFGRRKNRRARYVVEAPEDWRSVDMVDAPAPANTNTSTASAGAHDTSSSASDSEPEHGGVALSGPSPPDTIPYGYGSGLVRPPQDQADINGSVGGEKGWAERGLETDEARARRREGQRRAEEREMVRRAARRGCAFGFRVGEGEEKRKCEAVMKGAVVEASFAKGEWGVRWREE
ncbi:hypothetical protein C7974DRAFT_318649 [Boeremia exigua]|uniref:uncharacterized protein n=1 Tax=Boeremia exigua TaxID=749465 RepID=UPI001E8E5DB3|nr:uncharacterized protein C7974DRAFT_318649 [Boeremia exigua]KAH6616333.1 hypothetical protein C7974DRAFT_318649 [Boeremia exigua]